MMKDLSRRQFLQRTAGTAGAIAAANTIFLRDERLEAAPYPQVGANDRIRFGIIGVGMQGSGLLKNAIELPGVQCVAACDLYDERHTLAREIVGSNIPTTRRYQDLLDNKDIDCLIVAVPDFWHRKVLVDAVHAGKDIYSEKPMSHNAADGLAMVKAGKETGRIIQIGSQRVSSVLCGKAKELLAQGIVGDLMLIEGSLGRNSPNGAWEYPLPPGLSEQNFDWNTWQLDVPKRPLDAKIFARWRCWREYGTGVAGDLLVHLVSGMMFMLGINEAPRRAMTSAGILRWKDGRNMPDLQATLFEYNAMPSPAYLRLNLGTETPEIYRFQGSKGLLEVTHNAIAFTPQCGCDDSPSYYAASFPRAMLAEYEKQWHQQNDPVPGKEPIPEGFTFTGDSFDDLKPHLWNYFQAVRSRKPVTEDVVFGHHAALACHMANESFFRKLPTMWDEASGTIKS
jgi:predicted dehydrogenase